MCNWFIENKSWLFSGAGLTLLGSICKFLLRKKTKKDLNTQNQNVNINNIVNISNTEDSKQNNKIDNLDSKKRSTQILFIDDERFNMVKILKQAGWKNIEYKQDIINIDDIAILNADLIFIDINGVGCKISKNQGLGVAAAIKNKYPRKKVIIYSAEPNGNRFDKDLRKVDACLPKNAEPIEFMALIEDFIKK